MELLPQELIEDSIETFLCHHRTKSHIIYIITLITVSVVLIALPFIYIDISVEGSGIIRPELERSTITSPITEIVDVVYVHEGDYLYKGEPILKFRTSAEDYKIVYQKQLLNDVEQQNSDLKYLCKGICPNKFKSEVRQKEYLSYLSQREQLMTDLKQCKVEWLRNKILFDKKVISEEEYNKYLYQYDNKKNELNTMIKNKISSWQTDLNNILNQKKEEISSIREGNANKDLYVIKNPVNGTIEQFTGIYEGVSIQSGTQIAVIVPSSQLILETYVSPKDIAFIKIGMPVNVQIEALNYNEWGTINGTVKSISSDYIVDNNNNYLFKVKVKLQHNYLILKTTKRVGYLKKGMTAVAHFVVTRCSLLDLLYKRIDNCINPTQYINNKKK